LVVADAVVQHGRDILTPHVVEILPALGARLMVDEATA